jgi:hypothetical protein
MNFKNEDYIAFTGDTGDFDLLQNDYKLSELTLRFPNVNSILIPKKAEYNLRKYVSKLQLRLIDKDIDIAVEKCLVLLSNLASTYYTDSKWKRLHSKILHVQTQKGDNNTYIYTTIIDVLKAGTSKGSFIEVDDSYQENVESKKFRLTESYLKAGLVDYTIQNTGIVRNRNKIYFQQLHEAMTNSICSNLIAIYPKIDLPTSEELLIIGKQLVKEGRYTKKGKILTMRNKHKNDYWKDAEKRSFVEDNIELFEFLTGRGFMIPSAGNDKSGGRVVDSFTLMPAWIREQITIDGIKLSECDYTALHPNIALHLYNGTMSYLSHQIVAENTGIDLKVIKNEHLSFFNQKVWQMKQSPLYSFYEKHEPIMLKNIISEKYSSHYKYKITSRKMFKIEVAIMSDVIRFLNAKGVYVLYVYDALVCEDKHKDLVTETMNRIILEHGIKTTVKISTTVKDEPIIQITKETVLDNKIQIAKTVEKNEEQIIIEFSKLNSNAKIVDMYREKMENGEQLCFIDAIIEFAKDDTLPQRVLKIDDQSNPKACYLAESSILNLKKKESQPPYIEP